MSFLGFPPETRVVCICCTCRRAGRCGRRRVTPPVAVGSLRQKKSMAGRRSTGKRSAAWREAHLAPLTWQYPRPSTVRHRSNGQGSPEVVGSRTLPRGKPSRLLLVLFYRRRNEPIFLSRVAFSTLLQNSFRESYEIWRGSLTRTYQKIDRVNGFCIRNWSW